MTNKIISLAQLMFCLQYIAMPLQMPWANNVRYCLSLSSLASCKFDKTNSTNAARHNRTKLETKASYLTLRSTQLKFFFEQRRAYFFAIEMPIYRPWHSVFLSSSVISLVFFWLNTRETNNRSTIGFNTLRIAIG